LSVVLAVGALVATADDGAAQNRFSVEAFLGTALNVPTPLTLRQSGEPDLSLTARYDTRPLQVPVYWSVRLSLLNETRAFELQFNHQKLHLSNRPPEVQHFEVTHGFNLFTLAHRWRTMPVDLRLGAGIVLPHPEGTVRERSYRSPEGGFLGRGWHKVGPAFLAGLGKQWEPLPHLLVVTDGELVAAWAEGIPVEDGSADVSNVAFHLRVGVGYVH
jgi:hypothetical protein